MKTFGWADQTGATWGVGNQTEMTDTSMKLKYASEGLPAGHTDKFYVGGVTLDSVSLPVELAAGRAFLAGTNTNSAATKIALSGLSPDKWYGLIGQRVDSGGVPTGVYSNPDVINTWQTQLRETPAKPTLVMNPAIDSFYDWFRVDREGGKVHVERKYDEAMGHFFRLTNDQSVEASLTYAMFEGRKFVSPRYNWSLKYKVRSNGASAQQRIGFCSGGQCQVNWEWYNPHSTYGLAMQFDDYSGTDWPVGYDARADVDFNGADAEVGGVYATAHYDFTYTNTPTHDGFTVVDHLLWPMRPKVGRSDNLADTWKVPVNTVATIEFRFTKATDILEILVNDVVTVTYANVQRLVNEYMKYPLGEEYPMPIAPLMRQQVMGGAVNIDMGEIVFTSDCPYDMASLVAHNGGEYSRDGAAEVFHDMITTASEISTKATFLGKGGATGQTNRYTADLHSAYTLIPYDIPNKYVDYDENCSWANGASGAFKLLPCLVGGRVLRKIRWGGMQNLGSMTGRVLNADTNAQIVAPSAITDILGQSIINAPIVTMPDSIVPQVAITYTGPTQSSMTIGAPLYGPSQFSSVELYFGNVVGQINGTDFTLDTWADAIGYYSYDNVTFYQYFDVPVDIGVNETVYYYAVEGSYQTATKSVTTQPNTIKRPNGLASGQMKRPDGSTGGVLHRP